MFNIIFSFQTEFLKREYISMISIALSGQSLLNNAVVGEETNLVRILSLTGRIPQVWSVIGVGNIKNLQVMIEFSNQNKRRALVSHGPLRTHVTNLFVSVNISHRQQFRISLGPLSSQY